MNANGGRERRALLSGYEKQTKNTQFNQKPVEENQLEKNTQFNQNSLEENQLEKDTLETLPILPTNTYSTKLAELQAAETAAQQAEATHKQNAIAKLTALGLTADEIFALGVA